MSVATELQTLQTNIGNAYTTIGTKGGTVPANKNTDNLATAIDSIPSGGTPQPLDPQVVYQQTRPADWLEMPTPGTDEIYMLLQIPSDCIDDQDFSMSVTGSNEKTVSFGTVSSGTFVPDPDLVYTQAPTAFSIQIPVNKFSDLTSDGMLQLMCKISSTGITGFTNATGSLIYKRIVEFKGGNMTAFNGGFPGGNSTYRWTRLRYYSLGSNLVTSFQNAFQACSSLIAVLNLDTSMATNLQNMFSGCTELLAIPQIDTSSVTNFSYAFNNCRKIRALPLINTGNGTNFTGVFTSCTNLRVVPNIDTGKGTNFTSMFSSCTNLSSIPLLDTSKGTIFTQMFQSCSSLETIPALNTSEGTSFGSMLSGCANLTSVPQFNTAKGTDFNSMFQGCAKLTSIPLLNTSLGTDFTSMFSGCTLLASIPLIDTSEGTSFIGMFSGSGIAKLPQIDTSKGTSFTQMFQGCIALGYYDLSIYDFSKVTTTSGLTSIISPMGGETVRFNPTLDQNKIYNTGTILQGTVSYVSASNPAKIIFPQNSMVQIAVNATTLFMNNPNIHIFVPDNLLATYQADTYWATLGARLKPLSEWSA